MTTPPCEERGEATALAMEVIAGTLDKPDQPIQLHSQQQTSAVITTLAMYAGALLLHTSDEDTTARDLAGALRSAAELLRAA